MQRPDDITRITRDNAGAAVRLLKELANENRLLIVCTLAEGEHSVSELNQRIGLSQSALSQHLARLRAQGLVTTRREGQTIHYALHSAPALDIIRLVYERFCRGPDDANAPG